MNAQPALHTPTFPTPQPSRVPSVPGARSHCSSSRMQPEVRSLLPGSSQTLASFPSLGARWGLEVEKGLRGSQSDTGPEAPRPGACHI